MVGSVVRSEFILNKKSLLVLSIMVLCFAAAYPLLMEEVGASLAISCVLLGFYPATLLAKQSKFRADAAVCSLPVTRRQLITGKYAFMGLWAAAAVVVVLGVLLLVYRVQGVEGELLSADMVVNAVFAVTVLGSVLSPLVIAVGFMGVLVLILALNLAGVVLLVLTSLRVIGGALDFVLRDLPAAVVRFRATIGAPEYHLLLLACAAAVAALSWWISTAVYERKEF